LGKNDSTLLAPLESFYQLKREEDGNCTDSETDRQTERQAKEGEKGKGALEQRRPVDSK